MAIREGRWDCAACGRKANLGRDLRCGGCGRARGKVKFYLLENEPAVRQAEMLALANAGPDWVCAFCEASNRSLNESCTGCGAPRSDGQSRVRGGGDATELTDEQKRIAEESRRRAAEFARRHAEQRRQRARLFAVLGAVSFLLCSGMLTLFAFAGRAGGMQGAGGPFFRVGAPSGGADVELVSKTAIRRIDVEAQRLVTEESWCSSMPSDARELRRRSKQSGTRRVCQWDGGNGGGGPLLGVAGFRVQEDLGNGFFEDSGGGGGGGSWSGGGGWDSSDSCSSEPVYSDWCTWQAMRWVVVRSPESMSDAVVPPWPSITLARGERRGRETELFQGVVLSRDGERIPLTTDQSTWTTWQPGMRYHATWSFFGGLKSVGGPAASRETAIEMRAGPPAR